MSKPCDPWDLPEWRALSREAALIRHLLCSGITSLGRANYADMKGEYYTAFFGLSIGIERLCKMILSTRYVIENSGRFPSQKILRGYGHSITKLIEDVADYQTSGDIESRFVRPVDPICADIVSRLDEFADAGRGRYANFAILGDPNFDPNFEPMSKWWKIVAEAILRMHYEGKAVQQRIEAKADLAHSMMSKFSIVLYSDEIGNKLEDIKTASIRTGQAEIVQKYSRYYTLQVVRWLSSVFRSATQLACHGHGHDAFFGHEEYFNTFIVDNSFLKNRKRWPLT